MVEEETISINRSNSLLQPCLLGCTEVNEPITSESEGFWNQYIVYPLAWFIVKVAEFAGGSFGLSIIIVTIMIRLSYFAAYD